MINLKNKISWKVLIPIGIILYLISDKFSDYSIIFPWIGVLSTLLFIFGLIDLFKSLLTKKGTSNDKAKELTKNKNNIFYKNIIPVVIITAILLVFVFIFLIIDNNKSEQKNTAIQSNEKEYLFDKKMLCSKYSNEINKELSIGRLSQRYLISIFFSPKQNSCLYVAGEISNINGYSEKYVIYDFLTKERLAEFNKNEEIDSYNNFLSEYSK